MSSESMLKAKPLLDKMRYGNQEERAEAIKLAFKCGAYLGYDTQEIGDRIQELNDAQNGYPENETEVTPEEEEEFTFKQASEEQEVDGLMMSGYYSSMHSIANDNASLPEAKYDGHGIPEGDTMRLKSRR